MNDFKQIYLRKNNITDKIKAILSEVMDNKNISTASKAITLVVEEYPALKSENKELKDLLRQAINEKHDALYNFEKLQKTINQIEELKIDLEKKKRYLLSLAKIETEN